VAISAVAIVAAGDHSQSQLAGDYALYTMTVEMTYENLSGGGGGGSSGLWEWRKRQHIDDTSKDASIDGFDAPTASTAHGNTLVYVYELPEGLNQQQVHSPVPQKFYP